ncbi:MAG: class I tRNA ligase family protein, partial [Proteobacteria bacterium]|nr:class I tRNA ligase family protein [Pseudomonadota bacterium]
PERWRKTYLHWMENIQDWCISRQLWWGHRIPAWYDGDGNAYVGDDEDAVREKYGLGDAVALRRDDDVLDTWFSSALWPFSTLGWPEKTEALDEFYPGNVLVTGFDIIFFWVARMIMMGLKLMGDVPFREVYIHGLIRDHDGQKMSKSKGNVLDPLDVIDGVDLETLVEKRTTGLMQEHLKPNIEKATRREFPQGIDGYGADASRFTYAALATTGRDVSFDLGRVEGYRNFCNKLWNAARYVLMNTEALDDGDLRFNAADRWIRARLDATTREMHRHFATYRLDLAVQAIHEFTWHEFCDWYLELSKPVLQSDESPAGLQRGTRRTLIDTLEAILRLLHPLIPFITEEIWQQVSRRAGIDGETIMLQPYPEPDDDAADDEAIADIEWVRQFILGIRQIRGEMDISPGKALPVVLQHASDADRARADEHALLLQRVGRVESISVLGDGEQPPAAATALHGDMRLLVPMEGLIDVDAERARLGKRLDRTRAELAKANGKLGNDNFVNNAPAAVVEQERQRVTGFEKTIAQLAEQLQKLEAIS